MTAEPRSDARRLGEPPFVWRLQRLLSWRSDRDGRVLAVLAIALYLGLVAIARVAWGLNLWPYLGVPPGPSLFFDARNLTAALECHRLGYDPLFDNPCDPWRRPLMYLRPWLLLGFVGLDQSDTVALGVVLVAALFVTFLLLAGRVSLGTGLVLVLAACSPAVMLAVERANMDIALFSLIACAVLIWRKFPWPSRILSPVAVLVAAVAKVYPAFALGAFVIGRSRVAARTALLCAAAFGAYLVLNLRDVRHVAAIATQGDEFSYGARILIAHLYHQVGAESWRGPAMVKQMIALVPLAAAGAAVWIAVRRRFRGARNQSTDLGAEQLALQIGALIYLGTFATVNSFDYRLVFLLLTLPQLISWVRTPGPLTVLAAASLIGVLVLLWIGSLSHVLHLWDELASWCVAGLLAAVVAATIPPWGEMRATVLGGTAATAH